VLIFGEMYVLSLIFSYVAVCMFCAVRFVVSLLCASVCYWLIIGFRFINILFMFVFLFCMFILYFVHSVFCIVLFTVSPIAVYLLFLHKSTDRCHRAETQLQ
jgi:hypothetical protein